MLGFSPENLLDRVHGGNTRQKIDVRKAPYLNRQGEHAYLPGPATWTG